VSRLPGTENWSREDVAKRIAFLRACGERAEELAWLLGPDAPDEEKGPIVPHTGRDERAADWFESRIEAAELAFCTQQTGEGIALLRFMPPLQAHSSVHPGLVIFPVVSGFARLRVGLDRLAIRVDGLDEELRVEVPLAVLTHWWPVFILASLASGSGQSPFLDGRPADPLAEAAFHMALANAPETTLLPLFWFVDKRLGFGRQPSAGAVEAAHETLRRLEDAYAARLDLAQRDSHRWQEMRARGGLVDWPLLLIHLALRRRETIGAALPATEHKAARFIRALAAEIHNLEEGTPSPSVTFA